MPDTPAKAPAIVITRFPYESAWGGEESHTLALAKHFKDQGYEVIFLGSCPVLLEKFEEQGLPAVSCWAGKMIVTPAELAKSFLQFPVIKWNLKRQFESLSNQYDIQALYCLSLNEKLFLTPLALSMNIPVTWVEHQELRNWLLKNPWKKLYQKYAPQVKIVPIGKNNERVLREELRIPKPNIVPIVNGIAVEDFQQLERHTQPGLIVAANRLIPKKGLMDFLKALRLLGDQVDELEVQILGEGEEEKVIKSFIAQHFSNKKIYLCNFLKKENWHALLSRADVYVSCARDSNETFSLNTAEAMAAGCKVVVTECSGIADYFENKKNGFIVGPNDPSDLAEGIKSALAAPEDMRDSARQHAFETFDRQRMLEEYQSIILRNA